MDGIGPRPDRLVKKCDCTYLPDLEIRYMLKDELVMEYPALATVATKSFWAIGIVNRTGVANPMIRFEILSEVEYCPKCGRRLGGETKKAVAKNTKNTGNRKGVRKGNS